MREVDVLVIGGGVVGLSTAIAARSAGMSVVVLDGLGVANPVWASGDETRLFRLSYFEHPSYVPLLRRAIEGWHALGSDLLVQCGNLYGGLPSSALVGGTLAAAQQHGLSYEVLSSSQVNLLYPEFRLGEGEVGFFEAEGGYVNSRLGTLALATRAQSLGVSFVKETVSGLEPVGSRWSVGSYVADQVIVCTGWHTPSLVPQLAPFVTPQEHFVFWLASNGVVGHGFGFMNEAEEMLYGFPEQAPGAGIKVGGHYQFGSGTSDQQLSTIRELVQRYLPSATGDVVRSRCCTYDNSPDGNFMIGQVEPGLSLACGFSGHGYKFGSIIGEVVWQAATDGLPEDLAFLNVNRYL